jgi:hypothetical protein
MLDWFLENWHLLLLGALVLTAIIIMIVKRKKKKNPEKRLADWIAREKEAGATDEECYQRLIKYSPEWANPEAKATFYQALAEIDKKQPKEEKSPKEKGGSKNPWKAIAIVFIVVVVLIGLGFGYLTYGGYFQSSVNQNQNVTCGNCPEMPPCPKCPDLSAGTTNNEINVNLEEGWLDDYIEKYLEAENCTCN